MGLGLLSDIAIIYMNMKVNRKYGERSSSHSHHDLYTTITICLLAHGDNMTEKGKLERYLWVGR